MRKIALLQNSGASEGFAVFFPAFMSMSPRCLVHAVIDTGCCLEQNGLTLLQRASGVTLEGTTTGLTLRFGLVIGTAMTIRLRNLRETIAYKIGLRNKEVLAKTLHSKSKRCTCGGHWNGSNVGPTIGPMIFFLEKVRKVVRKPLKEFQQSSQCFSFYFAKIKSGAEAAQRFPTSSQQPGQCFPSNSKSCAEAA